MVASSLMMRACVALACSSALALVPPSLSAPRRRLGGGLCAGGDDEPSSLGGAMAKQLFGGVGAALDRLKGAADEGGDDGPALDTDVRAGREAARAAGGDISAIDARAQSGDVSFDDFLKIGRTFKQFKGRVPGMPGTLTDKEIEDALAKFAKHETIVGAMSDDEKADPQLVLDDLDDTDNKCPRVQRIAGAANVPEGEVALFVAEFEAMRQSTQRIAAGEDPDAVNADIGSSNREQRRALKKAQKKGKAAKKR